MLSRIAELDLSSLIMESRSSVYDCDICKDSGWLHYVDENGYKSGRECVCRLAQKAQKRIARSGLMGIIDQWTFDAFFAETATQKAMKSAARRYADAVLDGQKPWLFMGGQVGCGKSHLCTAVCGELLRAGKAVYYVQWVTDSRALKANANDLDGYQAAVTPFLNAEVLYIDDLFKMAKRENVRPTDADIRAVFEIINYRYIQNKPTIITSEWFLTTELLESDGGTFSRVYQKSKDYTVEISQGADKNYRLSGM